MRNIDEIITAYGVMTENTAETTAARAELAQLRATVAEQARQLEEAREIIKASQYLTSSRPILNRAVEQWLSANAPAPQTEQEQP